MPIKSSYEKLSLFSGISISFSDINADIIFSYSALSRRPSVYSSLSLMLPLEESTRTHSL